MGKKKTKKKKNKLGIKSTLVMSVLALLVSFGQLYFTLPFVLKSYEKVEIQALELGLAKSPNEDFIESSFIIHNSGQNTAQNVELHMRILENDRILFVPDVFDLIKGKDGEGLAHNLIYRCDQIVPDEKINIYVFSDYKQYLDFYELDTLVYNSPIKLPKYMYGPNIIDLKHSLGKAGISRQDSLRLRKLNY
jgi:hypothetical protein